jgi:hypothetical protein
MLGEGGNHSLHGPESTQATSARHIPALVMELQSRKQPLTLHGIALSSQKLFLLLCLKKWLFSECLLCKCKALSSNHIPTKKKKKKEKKERKMTVRILMP